MSLIHWGHFKNDGTRVGRKGSGFAESVINGDKGGRGVLTDNDVTTNN